MKQVRVSLTKSEVRKLYVAACLRRESCQENGSNRAAGSWHQVMEKLWKAESRILGGRARGAQ